MNKPWLEVGISRSAWFARKKGLDPKWQNILLGEPWVALGLSRWTWQRLGRPMTRAELDATRPPKNNRRGRPAIYGDKPWVALKISRLSWYRLGKPLTVEELAAARAKKGVPDGE